MSIQKFSLSRPVTLVLSFMLVSTGSVLFSQENSPSTPALTSPATVNVGPTRQKAGRGDFEATFDKVWKAVRDRFYDKKLHGVDWNKIGYTYREKLSGVKSKADFARLINKMLDELHASHTEYFTDDDMGFTMLPAVVSGDLQGRQVNHIGLMGQQEGDAFVVSAVLDGGVAEKAGLQCGDRILSADDAPFTTIGSFRNKEDKEVRLKVERPSEKKTMTVTVRPVTENLVSAFLAATNNSAKIIETGGKRIGYVHLWTMGNEAFRTTLERLVLGKLYNVDGLILDLRDGFGGMPWGYIDVFLKPEVDWEQQVRGTLPASRHTGFAKPMAVLINGGTRSAKEFFTYQFKKSGRATVIGTHTTGAFLGAGPIDVGKEGLLELAVVGLRLDGKRLEGAGVEPHIVVSPEISYTAADPQMAKAKEVLLEAIRRRTVNTGQKETVLPH